jgi:PHD/YefM family antitoxin component YafN of YafNO toxin-antitoxin module
MTVEEIARSVQFTLDQHGKTTAVVLTPELWRQLLEALEDAEDRALIRALRERIVAGPAASGALRWEDVSQDWA